MRLRKILVPTDFSVAGEEALEVAASLARDNGGKLVILHVEEPPMPYGGGEMFYGVEGASREDIIKRLREIAPTPRVVCSHKLAVGDPADVIVQIAESDNVDLIVMGTHGRTWLMRLLMGSVAEAVVRRAPCPVLTVRQPAAESVAAA